MALKVIQSPCIPVHNRYETITYRYYRLIAKQGNSKRGNAQLYGHCCPGRNNRVNKQANQRKGGTPAIQCRVQLLAPLFTVGASDE